MKPGSFFRYFLVFLVLVFLSATIGVADEKSDKVDKLFAQWDTTVTPGAALAVIKDGAIIYERGYGMAKLEDGLVITPSKIFDIGSVSKQFTAACVALLALEGKISLEDDIRKYIPEMSDYGKPVRIHHLVHHTSGLRDYNALLSLAGFRPDADYPTVEEAINILSRQKRLNFLPGEEYSYSNSGYFLMGVVVERVAGKTLNEFAQERIFRPLGMKNTFFQDDHTRIILNRATGYSPQGKGFRLDMSDWIQVGDGNVYTSVEDLYRWDQAFENNIPGKELMDMLQTPGVLNNGQKLDYAFGLVCGEYKGLKTVGHGGSWAGFRAEFIRFPEQRFTVICLANLSTINPLNLCLKVADIYLESEFKEVPQKKPEKEAAAVELSKEELEEKTGNYQDDKFGIWVAVFVREGKLLARIRGRDYALVPVSRTKFEVPDPRAGITLEFETDSRGKTQRARLTIRDEKIWLAKAPPVPVLTAAQLKGYEGEYVSDELMGAKYGVLLEKDGLSVKTRHKGLAALKPMAAEQFVMEGMNIKFVKGKRNEVTGFRLSVGRAAGIEFRKIK